jgi:hypothetical protein
MDKMDKIYFIKILLPSGGRGYIIDTSKGIIIATNENIANITSFKSYQDAQQFIRERKIERRGVKAYIRDNQDLIKEGFAKPVEKEMFFLENSTGEKLFYDSANECYYYDKASFGYCVWDSVEQLERFKKDWNIDGVIKKLQK